MKRKQTESTSDTSTLGWNDDDVNFDAGLEKWNVDVPELQEKAGPARIFRAWLEDWEKPLLRDNDPVSEAQLLEKYKGLTFHDIDDHVTYTVYTEHMEFRKYRGGGWCVIGLPPEYNGSNDDVLEPYLINENLVDMIQETSQPTEVNVDIIRKDKDVSRDTTAARGSSNDNMNDDDTDEADTDKAD